MPARSPATGTGSPGTGRPGLPIRRILLAALFLAGLTSLARAGSVESGWPSRTIRFVVPFGPGGANDLVARAVADGLARELGQPVIVENRPGAGSVLGADLVAKAQPDGYTLLVPAGGIVTNPLIRHHMPYREDDLLPVALLAVSPSVIVVPADSPWRDLRDLVTASRSGAGLNFSTAGTGSTPHFVAEMLRSLGQAKLQIVPYKSGAEGVMAVIARQVDLTSEASVVVLPQLQAGRLRALASTWHRRIPALADLPTAQELGYKGLIIGHWSGVFAPKGTPEPVLQRLNRALNSVLKAPALQAKLSVQGIEAQGGSRSDFEKFLKLERDRLQAIVQASGMTED